jgi:predicted RNA-binding protein with PUA-like domain
MAHWLVKSEPSTYSWQQMVADKRTHWNGVRNFQAAANLKKMAVGDTCFFYHSGEERAVVGVVEIAKTYYPDPSDKTGTFGMVDVKATKPLKTPVTLAQIKAEADLAGIALVRQSRLSVMPIDDKAWTKILKLGGGLA